MKRVPMLLLLIAPYLLTGGLFTENTRMLIGCSVLFAAILLFSGVYAFFLPKHYDGAQILFWNMLLKLCHIPFFLLVFLTVLLLHVMILPLLPLLFFVDYFLLLSSTMYGISGIWSCRRQGTFSWKAAVLHTLAQFLFCLDVVSAVCCFIQARKARTSQYAPDKPL